MRVLKVHVNSRVMQLVNFPFRCKLALSKEIHEILEATGRKKANRNTPLKKESLRLRQKLVDNYVRVEKTQANKLSLNNDAN